jgi:hypothetical protein
MLDVWMNSSVNQLDSDRKHHHEEHGEENQTQAGNLLW